jgi:hypothetical protein
MAEHADPLGKKPKYVKPIVVDLSGVGAGKGNGSPCNGGSAAGNCNSGTIPTGTCTDGGSVP